MRKLAAFSALVILAAIGCDEPELAKPEEAPKVIPKAVFDNMPPAQQEQFKAQGYEVVEDAQQPEGIPGGGRIPGQ